MKIPVTPIEILKIVNSDSNADTKLIIAGIACSHACALEAHMNGRTKELYQNSSVITKCIHKLLDRLEKYGVENEDHLSAINHTAKVAEILQLADAPEGVRSLGETIRTFADSIKIEKPTFTLTHLELLVNARRFNKRLPKGLSSFIKGLLDHQVHSLGSYWDSFTELGTLQGQLRKLWIQCMGLNLYNYNPDTSYTHKLIADIVPSVMQSENPEVHYLLNLLIHDCKIESIAINNYDSILNRLIDQTEDKASLFFLNAALLLNKLNAPLTFWKDNLPLEKQPSSRRDDLLSVNPRFQPVGRTTDNGNPYDIHATIKHHPTWMQKAIDFIFLREKGMKIADFCKQQHLPLREFSEFFNAVIRDVEKDIQQDPFLTKLVSLPHDVQDEYSALMRRKKEVLERICEAVSGFTGEKVDINDILNAAGNKNPALDKKMQRALDNLDSVNPKYALKFMSAFPELKRIEAEIEAFLSRHGL